MKNSIVVYDVICNMGINTHHFSLPYQEKRLLIFESYCVTPSCDCQDVLLTFQPLPDSGIKVDGNDIEITEAPLMHLRLDLKSWRVFDVKAITMGIDTKVIGDAFMHELTDVAKDVFLSHYREAKKYGKERIADYIPSFTMNSILKGENIGYPDIYGPDDEPVFQLSLQHKQYFILDQYCSNPTCDCKESIVSFYRMNDGKRNRNDLFTVRVDLHSSNSFSYTIEHKFCDTDLVHKSMKSWYDAKQNLLPLLTKRYEMIKKTAAQVTSST